MSENNPIMVVFTGIMGTGKTTFARLLADRLPSYVRIGTDEVRRMLGKTGFDSKDTPEVNNYIFFFIDFLLSQNKGIISDSANKTKKARDKLYNTARKYNYPILVIECVCSPETAIKRITSRPPRAGLHAPTNSAEDYHEYTKLCESIDKDISDPQNSDVSFVRLNTDTNTIEILKQSNQNVLEKDKIIELLNRTNREKSF